MPYAQFFLSIDIVAILVAIISALALGHYPNEFMKEGEALTWFSALQLLAIALMAGRIFFLRQKTVSFSKFWKSAGFIWFLLFWGFLFLCLDELMAIHEGLDRTIHYILDIDRTNLTDRLDDAIVLFYLYLFLVVLYWQRSELQRYRQVTSLFQSAIWLVLAMIFFDCLSHTNDIIADKTLNQWVAATEDSLKIIAEGLLLGISCDCLEIAKKL